MATNLPLVDTALQLIPPDMQRIIFTMMRKMACERSHSSPDGGHFPRYYQPLAADGYQNTDGGYQLAENAYRFAADDYPLATDRRYENAPGSLQT
jgi:hypothetical protein